MVTLCKYMIWLPLRYRAYVTTAHRNLLWFWYMRVCVRMWRGGCVWVSIWTESVHFLDLILLQCVQDFRAIYASVLDCIRIVAAPSMHEVLLLTRGIETTDPGTHKTSQYTSSKPSSLKQRVEKVCACALVETEWESVRVWAQGRRKIGLLTFFFSL